MEKKKNFLKTVFLIIIFIGFQTYFQDNSSFKNILNRWLGYFVPVIWAIILVILLNPLVEYLKRKFKIKQFWAVTVSIILVFLIFILLLIMIIPQISLSVKELNEIYPQIVEKISEFTEKGSNYLSEKGITIFDNLEVQRTDDFIKNNIDDIRKLILSILQNIIWWVIKISNFLMGLFLAVLILLDRESHLRTRDNFIVLIFGAKNKDYIINKLKISNEIFINYIVGKLIVSFVVGVSVFIILVLTKTPYASLSAVLLGIGNMIPYVGSILGGIIATFLILMVAPIKVLILFIAITISQLIDGFVIGPKIIGDKVGLNTFWVMVSVLVFGGLFGLTGMFLGVPIMCIIKLFYIDLLEKAKKEGD